MGAAGEHRRADRPAPVVGDCRDRRGGEATRRRCILEPCAATDRRLAGRTGGAAGSTTWRRRASSSSRRGASSAANGRPGWPPWPRAVLAEGALDLDRLGLAEARPRARCPPDAPARHARRSDPLRLPGRRAEHGRGGRRGLRHLPGLVPPRPTHRAAAAPPARSAADRGRLLRCLPATSAGG